MGNFVLSVIQVVSMRYSGNRIDKLPKLVRLAKSKNTLHGFTILFFTLLYIASCDCGRAQTPKIPSSFDLNDFYAISDYVNKNYLEPGQINNSLALMGASAAALRSLPYPLVLMTKKYYKNRTRIVKKEDIIPGRALYLKSKSKYLIFVPNYEKWEKINKARQEREKRRNKKLSSKARSQIVLQRRAQQRKKRQYIEKARKAISFSRRDFENIVAWIEANRKKYDKLPTTHKGENPYKEDPFDMHYVYFAAANGYLRKIDPHCAVVDRGSWNKMLSESEDSSFEGIGAVLRGGGSIDVIVETPLPGSPALRAGLRAGDIIRKVDGNSIENLSLSEVVKRIRGPRKTEVVLYVEREVELRSLSIPIQRDVIKLTAVSSKLISGKDYPGIIPVNRKFGLLKITSFLYARKNTSRLVEKEYKSLLEKSNGNLDGLFIDLRGNPGGYLQEAVAIADLLLPPKKLVVRIRGKEKKEDRLTEDKPMIENLPLIVLINANSASASEILASALKDHNIALVVGDRSFGKATVQSVQPLRSVLLKLTSARYYSPEDYTVQVYGVKPDISISDEQDGGYPPRFREEDIWEHLPRLKKRKPSASRRAWVKKLQKSVGARAAVEKYLNKHKNDALKPDYMLIRSLPYLEAMRQNRSP